MKVWHSSSSDSEPCVVCGKKTSHYKVYDQSSITVRIPLCDNDDRPNCYSKVNVKSITRRFLIELKKAVKVSAATNTD